MTINSEILKKLREPIPESQISWRVGFKTEDNTRGQALPYIDNRNVQNRLDDLLNAENWKNEFIEIFSGTNLVAVRCSLSIKVDGEWISKEDAAQIDASSTPAARELALKGAYSDAMKRAAVQWGIGRHLYDFNAPWVDLDSQGCFKQEMKLTDSAVAKSSKDPQAIAKPVVAAVPAAKAELPKPEAPKAASVDAEVLKPPSEFSAKSEAAADAQANAAAPALQEKAKVVPIAPDAPAAGQSVARSALYDEIMVKLTKIPPKMLRAYIVGPKGQEKLTTEEQEDLMLKVDQREAELST